GISWRKHGLPNSGTHTHTLFWWSIKCLCLHILKAKVLKTNLPQGHRAYEGHKKLITPNKRQMLPYFLNKTMTETESEKMMKKFHRQSLGQREIRVSKAVRDVTKYPVPECMCINNQTTHTI
ncbi:unnamed protein product, partial [Brassica rapa subsp. trilocularis]